MRAKASTKVKAKAKKSVRKIILTDESVCSTQIALNQVEQLTRLHQMQSTINVMAQNLDSIVTQINKANHELARRIEVLESKCADIDRILCKDKIATNQDPSNSIN